MATYQDGNRRRATANTVTAMRRSAETRQCPKCGRKSALKRVDEDRGYSVRGSVCRWQDCGYERVYDPMFETRAEAEARWTQQGQEAQR